jgi:uncharacterized membrane protein
MATLSAWKFATAEGAAQSEAILQGLQSQGLITVQDAATVSWPADKKKPKTTQLNSLTGAGALGGAFWGLLFGLIFFIPLLGLAVGAAIGAFSGSLADVGIDDNFIAAVREQITPGTSALFLLSEGAVMDKVHEAFAGTHPELIQTNLSQEQEDKLRAAFQEDDS